MECFTSAFGFWVQTALSLCRADPSWDASQWPERKLCVSVKWAFEQRHLPACARLDYHLISPVGLGCFVASSPKVAARIVLVFMVVFVRRLRGRLAGGKQYTRRLGRGEAERRATGRRQTASNLGSHEPVPPPPPRCRAALRRPILARRGCGHHCAPASSQGPTPAAPPRRRAPRAARPSCRAPRQPATIRVARAKP